jgi:hypothetical protein
VGPKRLTSFWKVRTIISLFVQMGCELRVIEDSVVSNDAETLNYRILLNPTTGGFATIVDLGDDEFVAAPEVASWERRLGVTIPKPP